MWTWASMKPGRSVASPRSMIRAPGGTARFWPTCLMWSPSTTTIPGTSGRSEVEVKTRAALSTVVTGDWAGGWPTAGAANGGAIPANISIPVRPTSFLIQTLLCTTRNLRELGSLAGGDGELSFCAILRHRAFFWMEFLVCLPVPVGSGDEVGRADAARVGRRPARRAGGRRPRGARLPAWHRPRKELRAALPPVPAAGRALPGAAGFFSRGAARPNPSDLPADL